MKKRVSLRIASGFALALFASYLGFYYLFWRDSVVLPHVFRWEDRFKPETVAFIPLIWLDRRAEARRDAEKYGARYAGIWVSETDDSSGTLTLEISTSFKYEFTLDYRGTTYSGKGRLEDNFLQDNFSCWTDSKNEIFLSLGSLHSGLPRGLEPSTTEILILVVIEPYGHIEAFDRAFRKQRALAN